MRKWLDAHPLAKSTAILGVAVLWLIGLVDQLADMTSAAKYVGISILLVAVSRI